MWEVLSHIGVGPDALGNGGLMAGQSVRVSLQKPGKLTHEDLEGGGVLEIEAGGQQVELTEACRRVFVTQNPASDFQDLLFEGASLWSPVLKLSPVLSSHSASIIWWVSASVESWTFRSSISPKTAIMSLR